MSMQLPTPRIGARRGRLGDWLTQCWVRVTGRRVSAGDVPWLDRLAGDVDGIGPGVFDRAAEREGLHRVDGDGPFGLLPDIARLRAPACDPDRLSEDVARFYEETSAYDFDVWAQWNGIFRPFGWLLALLFSRRLQQLNVPLSGLDTRLGTSSRVNQFAGDDGVVRRTAWVRELIATRNTLYAGSYGLCEVPGHEGACVRVVFPLPNGNANVILAPRSNADGSLTISSRGRRFGDAGFYFFVADRAAGAAGAAAGAGVGRYVRSVQEDIHVYVDESGVLRADHRLDYFGCTFLRLHYRMRRADPITA